VTGLFGRRRGASETDHETRLAAERAHVLVEESRESVVLLDEERRVVGASRRARSAIEGLVEGRPFPEELIREGTGRATLEVPVEIDGRRETLVYLSAPGDIAAYEELRAGFTAAVSHELRTPLTRLMALLDGAGLPGADVFALVEQARGEVLKMGELIDDVLFLSELESGRAVVALGSTPALGAVERVVEQLGPRAEAAGIALSYDCPASIELPIRERMLEVVVTNLVENAIRYAGEGASCTVVVREASGPTLLAVSDTGRGVAPEDVPRLFERFFRSDRARASRGTGLGLAIVKHVVTAAGGEVEARNRPEGGLEVECAFPVSRS
jgi:two-component system phosphate regulon sensor histidine kinase PhoR